MREELLQRLREAAEHSELLRACAAVRRDGGLRLALGDAPLRPLRADEVARLERSGNRADDWSRVRVAEGFDAGRVQGCRFVGEVVLGRFAGAVRLADGLELPAGVYDSTLSGCVVGRCALVQNARLLANYVVGEGALVFDCGTVACHGRTAFGNGVALRLGPETGGREVPVYAEIDVETAAAAARPGRGRHLLDRYAALVGEYRARATAGRGVIGPGAYVRATPELTNCYLGPHAVVDGATRVADSTLLSSPAEPARVDSGACVSGSLLQWGSRVSTLAVVQRTVLAEHAHAERHAKVAESLLGPNTAVAAGEVSSSLLGPLVGAHHQSLVIATLWPAGRGNVAHGASVGCNHTSRAPDQECWAGEGVFFGLGTSVQFPADFSAAPYTVIACGLAVPPQRVSFPFSLLAAPAARPAGVPGGYNEITPAWVLTENAYAVERTEAKLRARDRANRTRIDHRVFRPETVDLIRDACRRLEGVGPVREVYTEEQIPGLGKNFLRESSRRAALEAYRQAMARYALLGLKGRVEEALSAGARDLAGLLDEPSADPLWEHQRRLLREEFGVTDAAAALARLPGLLEAWAHGVRRSRGKDDGRGPRVIDDYGEIHPPADRDEVVLRAQECARRTEADVTGLLATLRGPTAGGTPPPGPVRFDGQTLCVPLS